MINCGINGINVTKMFLLLSLPQVHLVKSSMRLLGTVALVTLSMWIKTAATAWLAVLYVRLRSSFFVVFDDKVFGLNTRKCATIILCNFCTRKSPSFSISFTTVQTFMVHAKTQPTQKWYKPNGRKLIGRIARKLNRIKHVLFPLFFIPL